MSKPDDDAAQDWRSTTERTEETPVYVARSRAVERDRGRDAAAPQDFPPLGWHDILWRVLWSISADRVLSTAGSVAFFTLLAIFPGVATVVSVFGFVADPIGIREQLALLNGIVPDGVVALLSDELARVAVQHVGTLGLTGLAGLAVALWSANSGMSALFDALNVIYKEREKRSLARFYATTLLFTLGAVCFVLGVLGAVVVLPVMFGAFGIGTPSERFLSTARWPVLLLVVMLGLTMVYRFGPSRRPAKWRWVTWGSAAAAVLWVGMSMLFSWYVASFDSYSRVYGSLGAGVGFMTWIWLSVVVVLCGAELNAEMEHQTAADTTYGRPKPLGTRGAVVADTVGEAQS